MTHCNPGRRRRQNKAKEYIIFLHLGLSFFSDPQIERISVIMNVHILCLHSGPDTSAQYNNPVPYVTCYINIGFSHEIFNLYSKNKEVAMRGHDHPH